MYRIEKKTVDETTASIYHSPTNFRDDKTRGIYFKYVNIIHEQQCLGRSHPETF